MNELLCQICNRTFPDKGAFLDHLPHEQDIPPIGRPWTMGEAKTRASLPTSAYERKICPIASGVLDYFPDAIAEIAKVSKAGNDQHHPGSPLHWDRAKSTDEADALIRHFMERGSNDEDGQRHSAKMAWRALALLQKEIENDTP